MTHTVHVIDGRSVRDRTALVRQLDVRRCAGESNGLPETLIVLGAAAPGPGVVVLLGGRHGLRALRRWLNHRHVDMLMAWGELALSAVGAQSLPCSAVLDGLGDRAARHAALKWMRDRRMPVLVSSPTLGDRIDTWTGGRARVHAFAPQFEMHQGELDADALEVRSDGVGHLRVRAVLDPIIRLGLARRPLRCVASGQFADRDACHALLRSLDIPGLDTATSGRCAWVGGAAPPTMWRGSEPVLGLLEAWVNGSRLLLPRGHAAAAVLGTDDGSVLNCDMRGGAAAQAMEASAPTCTRGTRVATWQAAAEVCGDEIYDAAQHS